jgi:rhamnosyltransferase
MITCKLSIIIPTYNAKKYAKRLVESLKKYPQEFELIIIDSSSTDGSAEFFQQEADLFLQIKKDEFDHGGTRTKALQQASGEYVLFCTQDALICADDTIEKLLNFMQKDPKLALVYARQIPYESSSLFGKHLRYFNYGTTSYVRSLEQKEQYGLKTAFVSNSFALYKKKPLLEIGGFDSHLIVGEDTHAAARLLQQGYKIGYDASACVKHSHSYTLWQEFQRYFDIGVFHTTNKWLLEEFGKAEGEGMRYIKSEFQFLLNQKAYGKIPEFFVRNFLKFIGYKLGRKYNNLPKKLAIFCSMHKAWWNA